MDRRRRHVILRRYLCNRFWAWRFYFSGLLVWSLIEAYLLATQSRIDFIATSRTVAIGAVALTIVYKAIIQTVMVLTVPKTTLDRRWIWHLDSTLALFVLTFFALVVPEWVGLPKPGRPVPGVDVSDRLLIYNALWFQVWGFICWSALGVLVSTWEERGRFLWNGRTRSLTHRSYVETASSDD